MKRFGFTLVEWSLILVIAAALIAILWPVARSCYDQFQGLKPAPGTVNATPLG